MMVCYSPCFLSDLKLTSFGPPLSLGVRNTLDTGGQDLAGAFGGLPALKGVLFR